MINPMRVGSDQESGGGFYGEDISRVKLTTGREAMYLSRVVLEDLDFEDLFYLLFERPMMTIGLMSWRETNMLVFATKENEQSVHSQF